MAETRDRLDDLARLHRIGDADERRSVFRQAFATLAAQAAELTPAPLEGIDPAALRESMRVAFSTQLLEDTKWLSEAHATAALYELASALPSCDEKRELGRRVLHGLNEGDAQCFVLVATQLALSSKRGLTGAALHARVALALDLPIGAGLGVDALALALISRKDLEAEWLTLPSQGSLPSRRLAARLLDRAAREIARRTATGDESPLQLLERPSVGAAWARLLRDREPLVWRHVASARGLLAGIVPRFDREISDDLAPTKTPTEWRRAATSLAATLAVVPERALRRCEELLKSEIWKADRGVAASMILGLARAAEAEPQAAERALVMLVRSGGIDAIEALLSLREERLGQEMSEWTARLALSRLRDPEIVGTLGADDGHDALRLALERALRMATTSAGEAGPGLLELLADARETFLEQDARTAHGRSIEILGAVEVALGRLEATDGKTAESRRDAFWALRELDAVLFETSTLVDLLTLGLREEAGRGRARPAGPLGEIVGRLGEWLIAQESEPVTASSPMLHRTLRIRRLRVLLHLVDADTAGDDRTPETRERRLRIARMLLARARDDVPSPVRRIVHAAAARACEALLREEEAELSDVFVAVVSHLQTEDDLATFAEASMMPETESLFRAYASVVERTERNARVTSARSRASLEALRVLVRHLPLAGGPRVEALRACLLQLSTTLDEIANASSLAEIVGELDTGVGGEAQRSRILVLAETAESIARLVDGALRRMGYARANDGLACGPALRLVDVAALRSLRGREGAYADALAGALGPMREELPLHIAEMIATALTQTIALPRFAAVREKEGPIPLVSRRDRGLPAWLPPSRMLGGFYVLRALGSGAVGSVFVARRAEEKGLEGAQNFALKVPEYGGTVARTLSEEEFFQLFREEAGALLAVPPHPNLARLVTFDAGARPKPILVMELVEGPTLQRLIETGGLDMQRAVNTMLGVAEGLFAMHHVGVGHLDLKPSNVILRDPDGPGPALETPVLVDFGLAGRKLRPGCATANYGAPEVWGLTPKKHVPTPAAADVYAFGCLVYELLHGRELFRGDSDLGILGQHLQHDGDLPEIETLAKDEPLRPLAEVMRAMLRQDPRKRIAIEDAHAALSQLAPRLLERRWPLAS